MADVNIGDIVLIKVVIILSGQTMMNVYHYHSVSAETADDFLDAVDEHLSSCYSQIEGSIANDLVSSSIAGTNLTTERDLGSVPMTWGGGVSTADVLPTGVAALVTFPTATLRRRGRKFLPGFTENVLTDGLFNSTALAEMSAYADALLDSGPWGTTPINLNFVVVDANNPASYSAPTGHLERNIPAYQRRRKIGVGM